MIKAVIFDFDNTLMDFMKMKRAAVESAVDGMIDAGLLIKKQEMVEKIYKVYTAEGIEDQQIFDKVLVKELGKVDYKILAAGIIGYRRAKEGTLALYPHVHLTLTGLARMGLKMAVVSDAPRLPVWLRITGLGLQHYFDAVVTSDDAGFKKPHAKPFLMALEKLDVTPAEAIMIGDWVERDMVGAKKVGLQTVFARYGDTENNKESGADFEIDDVSQLLEIVAKGRL
jgi:putative hydrolase of the HAD superfamily